MGHPGEGLHELQVQDRGSLHSWWSFIEYADCQYVSLLIVFYFNKIGWFSAVFCHLKERRKKFRSYRCHPVYWWGSEFLIWIWLHIKNCLMTPSVPVVQEHPSEKGMYVYRMYGKFDDVTATEFLSVQLDMSDFRSTWDNSTAECTVLGKWPNSSVYSWICQTFAAPGTIVLQSVQYWVSDPVPQRTAGYVRLSLHLGQ